MLWYVIVYVIVYVFIVYVFIVYVTDPQKVFELEKIAHIMQYSRSYSIYLLMSFVLLNYEAVKCLGKFNNFIPTVCRHCVCVSCKYALALLFTFQLPCS